MVYFRMNCHIICNLSHDYFYYPGMQTFTSHVGADGATSRSDFIFTCPWEFSFVINVLQFLALQKNVDYQRSKVLNG